MKNSEEVSWLLPRHLLPKFLYMNLYISYNRKDASDEGDNGDLRRHR